MGGTDNHHHHQQHQNFTHLVNEAERGKATDLGILSMSEFQRRGKTQSWGLVESLTL